ncbi:hypothetical protein [Kordiimonas sp. SCSIO 12610]|uniref:hypothetical protein n=1 Tax=Kordiimonas sp. SCSIO 12610 TaxID=2829597 RepID=UPI00210E5B89|nr:hypothetical protein [Kordiimonas sp. SCSIO 12610]UTW54672.1 hypothetical protein KFF44_12785 [Kordiimonas sp. SCSIO 12610]
MFEIFRAEFLRYRKWAILILFVQLGVWAFITKVKPLLQPLTEIDGMVALVTIIGGLVFGIFQMIQHKRKANWTWLIQRPLSLSKIYCALSAAAIANILIAVPVAWIMVVSGLDLFTSTVVDSRHYVYGLHLAGLATTAYLVGTLTALSATRAAFLASFVIILWVYPKPQSMTVFFLLMSCVIAGLWYLNLKCFKPDLTTHVQKPEFIILMSLPMQATLAFLLMLSSTFYYHIPRFIIGNHPDNNPVEGSMSYLYHLDDSQTVGFLLKDTELDGKERLIRQTELADVDWITTNQWTFPSRDQMFFRDWGYGLFDGPTRTRWVFANDEMMLQGSGDLSGKISGWIGKNGFVEHGYATADDQFDTVPFMLADKFLVTQKRVYQVDYEEREMIVKFQVAEGSRIVNLPQINEDYVAIVTDKNTFIFDKQAFLNDMEPAKPDYSLPHPLEPSKIRTIETRRMVDGYLVLYFSRHYNGFQQEAASIHYARLGKDMEQIAKTDFYVNRHPAVIDNLDYVISPAVFMWTNQLLRLIEPTEVSYTSIREVFDRDFQSSVKWTALGLMILSSIVAFLVSRRIRLGSPMTILWSSLCLIFSVPALVSFFLMNKVRGV